MRSRCRALQPEPLKRRMRTRNTGSRDQVLPVNHLRPNQMLSPLSREELSFPIVSLERFIGCLRPPFLKLSKPGTLLPGLKSLDEAVAPRTLHGQARRCRPVKRLYQHPQNKLAKMNFASLSPQPSDHHCLETQRLNCSSSSNAIFQKLSEQAVSNCGLC